MFIRCLTWRLQVHVCSVMHCYDEVSLHWQACPHSSVEVRLRPPAIDLWTSHTASAAEVALLFLLLGAVYLHHLPQVGPTWPLRSDSGRSLGLGGAQSMCAIGRAQMCVTDPLSTLG